MFKKKSKEKEMDKTSNASVKHRLKIEMLRLIFVCSVLGIVIMLFLLIVASLVGSSKSSFRSVFDTIVYSELGTFRYEFDITSYPRDTSVSTKSPTLEIEIFESESEDIQLDVKKGMSAAWTGYEGVKETSWKYRNYKIIFEGYVTNLNPYTASIDIFLATENFNDKLTSIIAFEDNYYIDIEQMHYWLSNSKDATLMAIGSNLPEGSRYLVIPSSEFKVPSRYAELGEIEESNYIGLDIGLKRMSTLVSCIDNAVLGGILSNTDMSFSYSGESSKIDIFKSVLEGSGGLYRRYLSEALSSGLYSDSQYIQAQKETDNILDALSGPLLYVSVHNLMKTLRIDGTAMEYDSPTGGGTYEATLNFSVSTSDTDFSIKSSLLRARRVSQVTLPIGSTVIIDRLSDRNLLLNTVNDIVDYLNFTSIPLGNRLELTSDKVASSIRGMLIDTINNDSLTSSYLTMSNVDEFIIKYANYKADSMSTEEDRVNAKLVQDFIEVVDSITGDLIIERQVVVEEEIPKYTSLDYSDEIFTITGGVTEDQTNNQLCCIDLLVLNNTSDELVLDLTDFSLQTLLSSAYPSNNVTLLRSYNNAWDVDSLLLEVTLQESGYKEVRLFFVTSSDLGYMDLWYGDLKIGEVVSY